MKELTIEITDKCSLNCLHCSTMAGVNGKRFFSLDEVDGYLQRFYDFDVVRLSGGEPFEHPEIAGICEVVKSYGRTLQILSSGVKNRREIKPELVKVVKPYLDEVVFSIHGFYDVHDRIVASDRDWARHPPYWDMMLDSLDNLRSEDVAVSFQTVLMRSNFDHLDGIASAIRALKSIDRKNPYNWHILRFVKQGRGLANTDQVLDLEELNQFSLKVGDLTTEYNLNISFSDSFQRRKCDCSSKKAVVTCYGEIIPCSALKYGGNLEGKFACKDRVF